MTDLIYISEVSNYRLLNASFRIELAVLDMRYLLFLKYFTAWRPENFRTTQLQLFQKVY